MVLTQKYKYYMIKNILNILNNNNFNPKINYNKLIIKL